MAARDEDEDGARASDAAFENWLLAAAGADGPPAGAADAAWADFAEAAAAALRGLPDDSPLDGASSDAAGRCAAGTKSAARGSGEAAASRASAATWMTGAALGGTIVGGLIVALALRGGVANEAPRAAHADASSAEAQAARDALGGAPELVAAPAGLPPASVASVVAADDGAGADNDDGRASPAVARSAGPLGSGHAAMSARRWRAPPSRPASSEGERARPGAGVLPSRSSASDEPSAARRRVSSLEREVELLDAVRVANASGDFAKGIELVAEYRAEFERGELARDADVFEIEALAGAGERARAAQAARTFLSRYPSDPHAQRVRALAAASAR